MIVKNIHVAKKEAERFLKRVAELEKSQGVFTRMGGGQSTHTSKETAAVKRASMDLSKSLSVMRNERD